MTEFTPAQLAERAGEVQQVVHSWREIGLIGTREGDQFTLDDLGRIQMAQFVLKNGIDRHRFEQAAKQMRDLFDRFLDWLRPRCIRTLLWRWPGISTSNATTCCHFWKRQG
jgi:hypothetical protein